MVQHAKEYTFASGSSDNIKKWQLPEGRFMQNVKHYEGGPHKHRAGVETIVNAMVSINTKKRESVQSRIPSFTPVPLSFSRSPLSKTPKQVFFNPINIFDSFTTHYYTNTLYFILTFKCSNLLLQAVNEDDVLFSGGDDGTLDFWDWRSGHCFQSIKTQVQPGCLDAESAIYAASFDVTGSRLFTCEADKTIKVWKEDLSATEESHPIVGWDPKARRRAARH